MIATHPVFRSVAAELRSATLISFIAAVPFVILESLNQSLSAQNATTRIVLFAVLWALPLLLMLVLLPLLRRVRAGDRIAANPVSLVLRAAVSIAIVIVWGSVLADQMPCFLGVPNCD